MDMQTLSENETQHLLDLLETKRDKLSAVLSLTLNTTLEANKEGIDSYVALIEGREAFLQEALAADKAIQALLGKAHNAQHPDSALDMEVKRLNEACRIIVERIISHDKGNEPIRQSMLQDIKKSIKEANNQKSVNTYYQYDGYQANLSYFDKQK